MEKQAFYQDKKWLQEQINVHTTAAAVAREYGWGKTTISRWVKRLGVKTPELRIDTTKEYQSKEWLKDKLEELGSGEAIAREYGYGSSTIQSWINHFELREANYFLTKEGKKEAERTYQNKHWLEEKMEECKTAKAVAEKYRYNEATVQKWAKKLGVNEPMTKRNDIHYKDKEWLEVQFRNGRTIQSIADQFEVSSRSIGRYIEKFNIDTKKLQGEFRYPYKNKEWLERELKKHSSGNQIAKANNLAPNSVNRYIQKYNLKPHTIKPAIILELNHSFFEVIDSEEKAYWLGFMMADGYVVKRKTKAKYMIGLKLQEKDASHIEKFKEALETNAVIREINGKRNGKINKAREITFYSQQMGEDLINHGVIPNKTGKEVVPKKVPNDLMAHYMRGYFDGDGSSSRGIFNICCSHFMIQDVKNILINEGVKKEAIYVYDRVKVQVMQVNRREEVEKIALWLYKDATICLERKKENYIKTDRLNSKYQ